jgi:hypothetical protein
MAGRLDVTRAISGAGGLLQIDRGASLEFGSTVGSGQTVLFAADTGSLVLDSGHSFAATIEGFVSGDKIDLAGFALKGATVSFTENAAKTSGVLKVTSGAKTASFALLGDYLASAFQLSPFSPAGLAITYLPAPAASSAMSQAMASFAIAARPNVGDAARAPPRTAPPTLVHMP